MRVAVMGSGNGGCAVAFDFAQHGHDVRLFGTEQFPANSEAVAAAGGIQASGVLSGFAPVSYAGHDAGATMDGADLVIVVGPAYATEPLARLAAPHLRPGQAVVVCPSSGGGSLVFKSAVGADLRDDSVTVGDTSTLPYAVRITTPGVIRVFHKLVSAIYVAAVPRSGTGRLMSLLADVYPGVVAATSVLQTALQNGNPVIHPAVTLLNAALIERTGGDFLFYEEGITPGVGRLIEGVDLERLALAERLGLRVTSEPQTGMAQGYMLEDNYATGYSRAPGFLGIGAQHQLDHRYLTEDVGYGLVWLSDLGRQIGVDTPVVDAVIQVASTVLARDFRGEGLRTMASLGLADLSVEALRAL
ncbi:MAG: NAD/NADP octopine/nopaline dehydrogenase family protein [Dermatophilaceae bacterium]